MPAQHLDSVARLPARNDNVGIATHRLDAGLPVALADGEVTLAHSVPEGHRFAVRRIPMGTRLTSWGLPFGVATRDIEPGDYLVNERMLAVLAERGWAAAAIPAQPNFENQILSYADNPASQPEVEAPAVEPPDRSRADPIGMPTATFLGHDRGPRGVGTRNYIAIVGLTARVGAFARAVADACDPRTDDVDRASVAAGSLDGVVAIAHSEGAGRARPNNRAFLLRALAGITTHPNVGAALVDDGRGAITAADLQAEIAGGRPDDGMPIEWMALGADTERELARAVALVEGWRASLAALPRSEHSLARLSIALQCGGSDSFSGVSGNPLAAAAAREVVRQGGAVLLAETDELIGAEPYIMARVGSAAVGRRFLDFVARYKEFAHRHGSSAEHNPSGGNLLRGLYNVTLKSLGAALKLHPDLRIESAIDYAEPTPGAGFHFMNSPGNDLESVAGQVAGGANVIYFVTGNGSITNFPIVPTVKIVTPSGRFRLLERDMDVNAGAYLDGTPMQQLSSELLELTAAVASGTRSE